MIDTPQIVQTAAQTTAIIRITVPRAEIRRVMGPGLAELMATLGKQGIVPTGPWFTHHLKMAPEIFDFEIGVPVTERVTPEGRVSAGELPAATVARTIHHGPYEGLPNAWGSSRRGSRRRGGRRGHHCGRRILRTQGKMRTRRHGGRS